MLAFGLTLGLAIMSHLKLAACEQLNTKTCGGPAGPLFSKWLQANAMALRLNALELELVDATHATAIREHEAEDHMTRPSIGGRGSWDGRMRRASNDAGPATGSAGNGSAGRASGAHPRGPGETPPHDGKLGPGTAGPPPRVDTGAPVRPSGRSPVQTMGSELDLGAAAARPARGGGGGAAGARWQAGGVASLGVSQTLPGGVSMAESDADPSDIGAGEHLTARSDLPTLPDGHESVSPRGGRVSHNSAQRRSDAGRR
jgi:hypothetical protein